MKNSLIVALIFSSVCNLAAQTQEQKDSLINVMCGTIRENSSMSSRKVLKMVRKQHINPFVSAFPANKREELRSAIHFRAQRLCEEYTRLLEQNVTNKGDWVELKEKPISSMNNDNCLLISKKEGLYYKEANGDPVFITLDNGYWIDHFKDGTYSKLKLKWLGNCELEIEFVESNNAVRKNFSKPGDKYRYAIISKDKNYYFLVAEIPNSSRFMGFKVYY